MHEQITTLHIQPEETIIQLSPDTNIKIHDIVIGRTRSPRALLVYFKNLSRIEELEVKIGDKVIHLPEYIKKNLILWLQNLGKNQSRADYDNPDCHDFASFLCNISEEKQLRLIEDALKIHNISEVKIGDIVHLITERIPAENIPGAYYINGHSAINIGDNLYLGITGNLGICAMTYEQMDEFYKPKESYRTPRKDI